MNYTKIMAVRLVRRHLKRAVCVDICKEYPDENLTRDQFEHLVSYLILDTIYWD